LAVRVRCSIEEGRKTMRCLHQRGVGARHARDIAAMGRSYVLVVAQLAGMSTGGTGWITKR